MYAKILIILLATILLAGCATPDIPWIPKGDMPDPGAPALKKTWNPETQTITISTLDDTPRLTIQKISSKPDLCTFEEVLEIESFVDYDLNKLKDFRARWRQHKGRHNITKVEWFILKNESYNISVPVYDIVEHSQIIPQIISYAPTTSSPCNCAIGDDDSIEKWDITRNTANGTENGTICFDRYEVLQKNPLKIKIYWNTTEQTGSHNEIRYKNIWKPFSPTGKSIHAGQTYTVKIVYHKPAELGNVRIQTIPMFRGIECNELTWWNTSWDNKREIKIDNTGGSALTYYQVNIDLSGTPINSTSLRVVNETADATVPHWQETISSGNCTDLWFNATTIPGSSWLNGTYYIYYNNDGAAISSDGDATFLFFDTFPGSSIDTGKWDGNTADASVSGGIMSMGGSSSPNWLTSIIQFGPNVVYESRVKLLQPSQYIDRYGVGNAAGTKFVTGDLAYPPRNWMRVDNGAVESQIATNNPIDTWFNSKIILVGGTSASWYFDGVEGTNSPDTTNIPTASDLEVIFEGRAASTAIQSEWVYVRKYAATEPTATLGAEENSFSITSYAPTTPVNKLIGESQIFNVTALENCQCRWYIDGALVQTNATPSTTHAYTNTSLSLGLDQNFSAVVNTSTLSDMQTWDVDVSSADTFWQDMYKDRWMHVTHIGSSNTNLSEQFTTLAPYYILIYNSTDQKTYGYKSGRWEKYADKIIKPGEAAMLRYTTNITKTRTKAGSTFGLTLEPGFNHIGHSYNGTRNLTWYNTTIASSNLSTIQFQYPENGTLKLYTYGSSANGTVEVPQGCGVEVNVTADTVISGL